MPSLFDIGKSGLQAYRQSLAVTGQNIANVNTDGYKKRDVALEEVSGAGGGVTEISDQTGLGVRVEKIRRAFDEFLIDKARQASSNFKSADSFSNEVKSLENLLLPTDSNLSSAIGDFFNSLQDIAAYPDDQASRIVAIEKGKDLAAQFNMYSDRIENLKDQILDKTKNAVTSVNLISTQISNINAKILASGVATGGSNALLDQRDLLQDQMSELTQITVRYGSKGQAEVRLGNTGSGPIIISDTDNPTKGNETTTIIDVLEQSGRLQPVVGIGQVATNQIKAGLISGMINSFALAEDTLKEIDALASLLSQKFNEVNQAGLDLDGKSGKQMFTVSSLKAVENPTNRSSVGVAVFVTNPLEIVNAEYKVMYNENEDLWKLTSDSLKNSIAGKQTIEGQGFKISFFGEPLDGDEFSIVPSSASKGMSFLLERPQDFAAGARTLISSSSSNTGTATLDEITKIKFEDKTTIGDINNVFSNGLSPVTSSEFSADGGAAIIKAGTSFVNLSSYKAQPEIQFGISSSDLSSITSITVTMADSSSVTVDLTGITTLEELADVLNRSRDVQGNAHNFRSMGLFASGGGSSLTIASNDKEFSSGAITASSTINANVINPTVTAASELQIFTREGRHIAGSVLSDSEIAEFLTQENGFNRFAEYRADYLNGTGNEKYRGIDVSRSTTGGNFIISYGANGTAASAQRHATTVPASHVTAAYTLTVNSTSTGKSKNISVPIESSAGFVAGLINEEAKTLGIEATASTKVKLTAPSSDGTISFNLLSKPGVGNDADITAAILSTDLTNLANAINNFSGRTGVVANLSSDKKHIVMENADGDDIQISAFSSPNTVEMEVLKSDFSSFSSAITVNLDNTNFKAARFSGELKISSASAISTSNDGGSTTVSGTQNALSDGFLNVLSSSTGEIKTIKPVLLQGDFSTGHPEGSSASSSVLSYGLKIPADGNGAEFSSTVDVSSFETLTPSQLAKKIADGLRSNSPSAEIIGTAVDSIPEDGSSFRINHDGLTYTLTMENGEIVVSGGEKDLITAYFEDPDPITINTTALGGTDTITSTEHNLKTGDAITYNAAEKVTVDTTNFSSTNTISVANDFSDNDPVVYKKGGSFPISGLVDGTTYFVKNRTATSFQLSETSGGSVITITGGTGGSVSDTFASPRGGLVDGQTYFVVKVDDHNFKLANNYTLATNSTPSVITIGASGVGGNASDTFDPQKNLYISAGKTISGSQFSFPVDSINDDNAKLFGMQSTNVKTTITGLSVTTPTASNSTHFHIKIKDNTNPIGVFVKANSKTINTSGVGGSSTTLTSAGHGFKTGDKITYTAGGTQLNGLTNGTSYFAKVVDANTFSLASSFANATSDTPTLLSFGGGNGHASDTFASVVASALLNDNASTPASAVGISAEINQVSDTNAQISIIKEADKKEIVIDRVTYSDSATAEAYGFKTSQLNLNVLNDEIRVQSFSSGVSASHAVDLEVPSNSIKSLVGNNLSISNIPSEDLIVLMTGNGSKKIASSYGEIIPNIRDEEFKVQIDSTNNKKVEILDSDTGHTIASRLIPDDGIINAVGKSLRLTGDAKVKDSFTILNNNDGIGDNRNILKMIDLQQTDVNGLNSGSFQDIFNKTATEIGATVRSSQMEAQDAKASKDEAIALEDEKSGVSLDEEASSLIQFQQAFSANARIIQTARELFDSLMRVVSQ